MATLQVEKIRANLKVQCSHIYLKVYGHEAEIQTALMEEKITESYSNVEKSYSSVPLLGQL